MADIQTTKIEALELTDKIEDNHRLISQEIGVDSTQIRAETLGKYALSKIDGLDETPDDEISDLSYIPIQEEGASEATKIRIDKLAKFFSDYAALDADTQESIVATMDFLVRSGDKIKALSANSLLNFIKSANVKHADSASNIINPTDPDGICETINAISLSNIDVHIVATQDSSSLYSEVVTSPNGKAGSKYIGLFMLNSGGKYCILARKAGPNQTFHSNDMQKDWVFVMYAIFLQYQ